jgi:zinc protease
MYDMTIYLKGGHRLEADMTNRIGIANLWAAMMNESTKNSTKEEIENQELLLGSNISISSNNSSIVVSVSGLKKNIDKTLALLEERMNNPKFDQKEFDRVKTQVLEGIQNNATQPTVIASQNFARLLYGDKNIVGIPASGNVETVQGLMLDDVKSFHNRFFNPANAEMVIVGDLTESEIMPKISFIEKWQPKSYTVPVPPAAPAVEKTTIYLIDKAGAPQSEIRVGYVALPYDATGDYYRAGLMNFTLGGQFNSRINLLLREEKGYTYGANTRFQGSDIAGPFAGGAGVKASTTDSSVYYFMKLINDYRKDGITKEELDFTKKSLSQSEALDYETLDDKANFLYQIQHYNLSKDYVKEQATILDNITQNDINEIAKKRLPSDKMIILVVGNKAEILEGLKGLGYPIVELTKDGKPVEVKK